MAYLCHNCEETFDEPKTDTQSVPYGMGNAAFEFYVCPYCNSDDYEEVTECKECGKVIDEDNNFSGLCAECVKENCNLPVTVFDFSVDIEPDAVSDFALKCLGAKGINEILRQYFQEISETDIDKFAKEQDEYIDEYIINIGEWLEAKENDA